MSWCRLLSLLLMMLLRLISLLLILMACLLMERLILLLTLLLLSHSCLLWCLVITATVPSFCLQVWWWFFSTTNFRRRELQLLREWDIFSLWWVSSPALTVYSITNGSLFLTLGSVPVMRQHLCQKLILAMFSPMLISVCKNTPMEQQLYWLLITAQAVFIPSAWIQHGSSQPVVSSSFRTLWRWKFQLLLLSLTWAWVS